MRSKTRNSFWLAALTSALFLMSAHSRAQNNPLSLSDCYRLAERNQPDLATAEAQIHVAEAHLKERRSSYFPHLSFGASHNQQTYNYAPTPGTSPATASLLFNGERWSSSPYFFTGLNFSQNIYDFGLTRGSVVRGNAELAQSQQNRDRIRQQTLLNVRNGYFAVLAAQELVQVRQKTVQNQTKHLDQINAFFNVGRVPKIDLTRQQVQLANAQLLLVQAQSDLTVAQAALATAMGLPVKNTFTLVDVLGTAQTLDPVDSYLTDAQTSRPDLRALREVITAAEGDIVAARSNFRPHLNFTSFADFENLKFPLIWNLGFGESLLQPLLSGGFNRAFLNETEQAKSAAESNLRSATLQVDNEVYTDYANTTVSQQQIDLATKADQEAQDNLAFAEGRYSAGVGNIIELTDAELLAATAGAQVVTARYSYQLAYGRLEVAAGKDPSD
ncbi:MAG TPA: TolC family protein [Candidatus Sulfotelmatobacter sp.]|jgi:outer membrane protein|nr:TolC family protein [Candidatus Sulfotelmatobacter sp.]